MLDGQFTLPIWYDLLATFAFAITGAVIGLRKHYDIVGVTSLALAVGVGGGIIRDGIFLQTTPAIATDWRYMATILLAVGVAIALMRIMERKSFVIVVDLLDALGLAAYTVVGTQKSVLAGLAIAAAVLVGVINAVGGGVLRDILSGQDPRIFRPSQLYALISVCGGLFFVLLAVGMQLEAQVAAILAMAGMIVVRTIVIVFNVQTVPAHELIRRRRKDLAS